MKEIKVDALDVIDLLHDTFDVPSGICIQLSKMILALNIITKKEVSVNWFKESRAVEEYNEYWYDNKYQLSKQEFDLLKEVIANEE